MAPAHAGRKQTASRSTSPGVKAGASYINGYRKTIAGQVLAYHSSHPDADSALLVRANKEAPSITWETDPLPAAVEGDFYRLVWLAGLEREGWPGKESHKFDLYINGDRWFTFQNLKDAHAWKWQVPGKLGAELSFEAVMADRAGDLFGYMYLKLPRSAAKPGAPLTLQVQGENAGSLDWYMTLQYPFRFTPAVRAEPALMKDGDRMKQLLRLSCDNLQEGRSIEVSAAGMAPIRQPLAVGANILYLPIPALETQSEIPVVFSINGEAAGRTSLTVPLVKWREVYLLCYSHNDIGYTDIQPVIEKKQRENLDEALRLIRQTRDYPYEARFKWNMEVMWPLEGYLAQASEQKRREVIQAVREGSLGLNALYANVLTGLASAAEMSHFTEYAERFRRGACPAGHHRAGLGHPRLHLGHCAGAGAERRQVFRQRAQFRRPDRPHAAGVGRQAILLGLAVGRGEGADVGGGGELCQLPRRRPDPARRREGAEAHEEAERQRLTPTRCCSSPTRSAATTGRRTRTSRTLCANGTSVMPRRGSSSGRTRRCSRNSKGATARACR